MSLIVELPNCSDSYPSAESGADPQAASSSGTSPQQNGAVGAQTGKKKRRNRGLKIYNKSVRRLKRLGYKRGYRCEKPKEEDAIADVDPDGTVNVTDVDPAKAADAAPGEAEQTNGIDSTAAVEIGLRKKSTYRRRPTSKKNSPKELVPVKPCTYLKVNGKSARYQNETEVQRKRRLASYTESRRRQEENKTEEQREKRLRKVRETRRIRYTQEKKPRKNPLMNIPSDVMHPHKVLQLQREYEEFKKYVAKMCPRTHKKPRTAKGRRKGKAVKEKVQVNDDEENSLDIVSDENDPQVTRAFRESSPKIRENAPKFISSNIPIDPELALLETSDETFVPVQVIMQTYEDFDDMFEIENIG